MSDDKLDQVIDRAVRRIMAVDPPAGLRRRVQSRIESPAPRMRIWPGLGFATAALALALFVTISLVNAPEPVLQPAAAPVAANAPVPDPSPQPATPEPVRPEPDAPRIAPRSGSPAVTREALPAPPRMDSVFGAPGGRISAASAGEGAQKPAVNLRLEFTFTHEGMGVEPGPKTVTMVVADQQTGRHRSAEGASVTIEARPRILPDGRIQVTARLEYRAAGNEPATLSDSVSAILEDGQALIVSRADDGGTKRSLSVQLKTTIVKPRP